MRRYHLGSWGLGVAIGLVFGIALGLVVLQDVVIGMGMGATLGFGFAAAGLAIQDGNQHARG
jgi:hypothetical protein